MFLYFTVIRFLKKKKKKKINGTWTYIFHIMPLLERRTPLTCMNESHTYHVYMHVAQPRGLTKFCTFYFLIK
jgi:hypothetical protein